MIANTFMHLQKLILTFKDSIHFFSLKFLFILPISIKKYFNIFKIFNTMIIGKNIYKKETSNQIFWI